MKTVYVLCNDAGTLRTREDAQRATESAEGILFTWEGEDIERSSVPGVAQTGYHAWVKWGVEWWKGSKTFFDDDNVYMCVTTRVWASWQQSQRMAKTVRKETLRQMQGRHAQERGALLAAQHAFMQQEYLRAVNFVGTWDAYVRSSLHKWQRRQAGYWGGWVDRQVRSSTRSVRARGTDG